MGLFDSLTTLDKPTIIIIVMGVIIVVLLYLNYMRGNESNAQLGSCNCSTEHLTSVQSQDSSNEEKQNIQNIPKPAQDQPLNQQKSKLTVYYTTWCGYSKMFLNEWDKNLMPAIESANDIKTKVIFEKVDCDQNTGICEKYKIEGYPTILFHSADGNVHEYNGERSTEKILAFVREKI